MFWANWEIILLFAKPFCKDTAMTTYFKTFGLFIDLQSLYMHLDQVGILSDCELSFKQLCQNVSNVPSINRIIWGGSMRWPSTRWWTQSLSETWLQMLNLNYWYHPLPSYVLCHLKARQLLNSWSSAVCSRTWRPGQLSNAEVSQSATRQYNSIRFQDLPRGLRNSASKHGSRYDGLTSVPFSYVTLVHQKTICCPPSPDCAWGLLNVVLVFAIWLNRTASTMPPHSIS